jgi:hypothetical protein
MKQTFDEQAQAEKIERQRLAKEMEARILRDADDTIRGNLERTKNRLAEEAIARAVLLAEQIASQRRDEVDVVLKHNFLGDLRDSVAEKPDYVMNDFVKSSIGRDLGARAGEVH